VEQTARPKEFKEEDKIKMLLWCDRHCCMCKKTCATDIEIAHIDRRGGNDIENGIPLCYDCHAKIGHYNREHPRGNKYKPDELKARREQIYEEYTRNLVPPIHFYLDQRKVDNTLHDLPFVGFRLQHVADSLPVRVARAPISCATIYFNTLSGRATALSFYDDFVSFQLGYSCFLVVNVFCNLKVKVSKQLNFPLSFDAVIYFQKLVIQQLG
jgi:hypothetical protein